MYCSFAKIRSLKLISLKIGKASHTQNIIALRYHMYKAGKKGYNKTMLTPINLAIISDTNGETNKTTA